MDEEIAHPSAEEEEDNIEGEAEDEDNEELPEEEIYEVENKEQDNVVPSVEDDVLSNLSAISTRSSLYDEAEGYEHQWNIQNVFYGFNDHHQNKIFPLVDVQSQVLFEIVLEKEQNQLKSSEKALLGVKKSVAIPSNHLAVSDGGPEFKLRIIDPSSREEESSIIKRAVAMASNVTDVPDKILAALPTDSFTNEKKALLMKTLESGWKREIVMRSNCSPGKKMGDVYYFAPDGIKFRSSKQVAIYLAKKPELGLTVDHFTFAKARVSFDPEQETVRQAYSGKCSGPPKQILRQPTKTIQEVQESLFDGSEEEDKAASRGSSSRRAIQPPKRYATADAVVFNEKKQKIVPKSVSNELVNEGGMEMGMLPPKYPRGIEDSYQPSSSTSGVSEDSFTAGMLRRGRPPKPGGKRDLIAQARAMSAAKAAAGSYHHPADEDGGPMFGISALTQSSFGHFGDGMNYGHSYRQDGEGTNYEDDGCVDESGEVSQNSGELLPCSIRCPGMSGDIPTLQCRRCLCLYHPQCLGLPNQNYRNFFCSNCEDPNDNSNQGPAASQNQRNHSQHGQQQQMRMMGDPRRPPPSLIRMKVRPQQQHIPHQQQMRNVDPRRIGGGSGGNLHGLKIIPRGGIPHSQMGRGGMRQKMRIELPKLNLPMIRSMKRPGVDQSWPPRFPEARQQGFGRGRGRPPRAMGMPQFNNRLNSNTVTITPIAMQQRKGGIPNLTVPKLQPMRPIRDNLKMPLQMRMGPGRLPMLATAGYRPIRPKPFAGSEGLGNNKGGQMHRMQMNRGPALRVTRPNIQATRPNIQGGVGFKPYPQSVVTINQKKYIVMPKGANLTTNNKVNDEDILKLSEEELQALQNQIKEENKSKEEEDRDESEMVIDEERNGGGGGVDDDDDEDEDLGTEEKIENEEPIDEESSELGEELNFSEEDLKTILESVFKFLSWEEQDACGMVSKAWRDVYVNYVNEVGSNENE